MLTGEMNILHLQRSFSMRKKTQGPLLMVYSETKLRIILLIRNLASFHNIGCHPELQKFHNQPADHQQSNTCHTLGSHRAARLKVP